MLLKYRHDVRPAGLAVIVDIAVLGFRQSILVDSGHRSEGDLRVSFLDGRPALHARGRLWSVEPIKSLDGHDVASVACAVFVEFVKVLVPARFLELACLLELHCRLLIELPWLLWVVGFHSRGGLSSTPLKNPMRCRTSFRMSLSSIG